MKTSQSAHVTMMLFLIPVSVFTLQLFCTGEVEVVELVGHHDLTGVLVHCSPAEVLKDLGHVLQWSANVPVKQQLNMQSLNWFVMIKFFVVSLGDCPFFYSWRTSDMPWSDLKTWQAPAKYAVDMQSLNCFVMITFCMVRVGNAHFSMAEWPRILSVVISKRDRPQPNMQWTNL